MSESNHREKGVFEGWGEQAAWMSEPKRVKKAFRQGGGTKQSRIGDARIMGVV